MTVPSADWRERLVSEPLRARLRELIAEDGEARVLSLLLGEPRIFEWLHAVAALRDPVLRGLVPPLPPHALREITAHTEPELFLWTGLVDVEALLSVYMQYRGAAAPARPRLLDFGCGCGRLLRFLTGHDDLFDLHGADVNPAHVAWCADHLPPIRFATTAPRPPAPYADCSFDGIWCLSVFTHLDEAASDAWRAEMARLLVPGGLLIATLHGLTALKKFVDEPALQERFRLPGAQAADLYARFAADPFVFVPYDKDVLAAANAGDVYGTTFTHPSYVARRWTDDRFEVLAQLDGGLRGWQDVVVLRRR